MQLRLTTAVIAVAISACQPVSGPRRDPHSHAQPDRVSVKHLALDLGVDFETKRLTGTARLTLERRDKSAPLVLDSNGLVLQAVRTCEGVPLKHRLGSTGHSGQPLVIERPGDCVEIAYHTQPDAGALLWVEPEGTSSGKLPMLFTQSQATRARTWIPLQDSPSVRFTYEATIRPPKGMWALMSAHNPQTPPADGVWRFSQPHPIPSYLMALAVGEFAFRPTGPRSGVYAEPDVVDAAAEEFSETEAMMTAGEQLYGPYRWGRYDILVLPPSFPFGGMENPNLTFLTPTVISGDKTLVSLIAHELAHSWSGNLATNSTWNDVWLNEGFTTYVEHRIMEQLRGVETSDVLWYTTRQDIDETIADAGMFSPRTRLAHSYNSDVSEDSIPSDVAYTKGALFLRTLEFAHGRETFDRFLRGWFDRHSFAAVDTRMFIQEAKAELGDKVDLEAWAYGTGLPSDAAPTSSSRATALHRIARDFATQGRMPDATRWTTIDWVLFITSLPKDVAPSRLAELDDRYQLTTSPNAEIGMHWLPRVVVANLRDRGSAVQAYLLKVGRRRNVVPLYQALAAADDSWRALARTTFDEARPRYHPITRETVAKIIAGG